MQRAHLKIFKDKKKNLMVKGLFLLKIKKMFLNLVSELYFDIGHN